jgi:hypothetical protein
VNAVVKVGTPAVGELIPIFGGGRTFVGKGRQRFANLREGDACALCHFDDGDAAKNFARVSPLVATVSPTLDEALSLVEVESRDGDAAASGYFADSECFVDFSGPGIRHLGLPLDLKFT